VEKKHAVGNILNHLSSNPLFECRSNWPKIRVSSPKRLTSAFCHNFNQAYAFRVIPKLLSVICHQHQALNLQYLFAQLGSACAQTVTPTLSQLIYRPYVMSVANGKTVMQPLYSLGNSEVVVGQGSLT